MELQRYLGEIPTTLKPIYANTKGILVYQEQILQLAQLMAGYTMGGADLLRRAIGKKSVALLASLKAEYVYGTERGIPMLEQQLQKLMAVDEANRDTDSVETFKSQLSAMRKAVKAGKSVPGCINRGYDEEYSITTFDAIQRFAGYSFNRSHSLAYGLLAYWTAYMKTHHPVEFMAAQLTVQGDDEDKTIANVQECRRLSIPILPPDINRSRAGFNIELMEVKDEHGFGTGQMVKAIRFGIASIKGIGGKVVQEVLERPDGKKDEMPEDGVPHQGKLAGDIIMNDENIVVRQKTAYASFDDFFNRVDKRIINKSKLEILIKAGCFDFDEENRYELLNHFFFDLRKDKKYEGTAAQYEKEKKAKKTKMTTLLELDPKKYDVDALSEFEKELFGFYLSHHPFQDLPYVPWHEVMEGQQVDMGGKIKKIKKIKTKKKDDMCFLTVETAGGIMDVTVFPRQFKEYQQELFTGNIAIFRGAKQTGQNDKSSILLDKMLKPRKKKFKVDKPEEDPQAIAQPVPAPPAPVAPPIPEVTVRPDPMAGMYVPEPQQEPVFVAAGVLTPEPTPEPQQVQPAFDLADLFEF